MKELCRQAAANGRRIGFVPTMGALHAGHLSLIRRVKELSDLVVVSIFVNPTQFAAHEDLARYPRDLARDVDVCAVEEVDYVFAPAESEMYPTGSTTFVEVHELSDVLEGASRPGHFRGVTTVVLKLLEIIRPSVVAFGRKDYQQAAVIQRMVRDLMLDAEILELPTVRDHDELALSSRNRYLNPDQRQAALAIPRSLHSAGKAVEQGARKSGDVVGAARAVLEAESGLEIEYVALFDRATFTPLDYVEGEAVLLVAANVGGTRLIDNAILRLPEADQG